MEWIQCCVQFRVCPAFADGNLCPVVTLWTATNTPLLRHFSIFLSSLPLLHPLSSCPPPPCSPRSPPRSAPLSPSPPGPWPPPMWSDNSPTIQRFGPPLSEPFICLCAALGWWRASFPAFQCAEQENGRRGNPLHFYP